MNKKVILSLIVFVSVFFTACDFLTEYQLKEDVITTPANLKVESSDLIEITISWDKVENADFYKITYMEVGKSNLVTISDIKTTTYTITGLNPSTTYEINLYAARNDDAITAPATMTAQTRSKILLAPPTTVSAELVEGTTSIKITWSQITNSNTAGYVIERREGTTGTFEECTTINDSTILTYIDTNLAANTTYYYRVYSLSIDGKGTTASSVVNATTSYADVEPPASVSAELSGRQGAIISWTAVDEAIGYVVYSSTLVDSGFIYTGKVDSGTILTFTCNELESGTTYYFKIASIITTGTGLMSTVNASITTPLGQTSSITVLPVSNSDSSLGISWTAVTGATGYKLYRCATVDGTYVECGTVDNITIYTDTGLEAETMYYYKVQAVNSNNSALDGELSSVYGSATTNPELPDPPTNVTTSASGVDSIIVSWSAVEGATGYVVYRSTTETGSYTRITTISDNTALTYTNTSLTMGASYYYKVSTVNATGEGEMSPAVKGEIEGTTTIWDFTTMGDLGYVGSVVCSSTTGTESQTITSTGSENIRVYSDYLRLNSEMRVPIKYGSVVSFVCISGTITVRETTVSSPYTVVDADVQLGYVPFSSSLARITSIAVVTPATPDVPNDVMLSYSSSTQTIEATWTDPENISGLEISFGKTGETAQTQSVNLGTQSFTISNISADNSEYTVTFTTTDAKNRKNSISYTVIATDEPIFQSLSLSRTHLDDEMTDRSITATLTGYNLNTITAGYLMMQMSSGDTSTKTFTINSATNATVTFNAPTTIAEYTIKIINGNDVFKEDAATFSVTKCAEIRGIAIYQEGTQNNQVKMNTSSEITVRMAGVNLDIGNNFSIKIFNADNELCNTYSIQKPDRIATSYWDDNISNDSDLLLFDVFEDASDSIRITNENGVELYIIWYDSYWKNWWGNSITVTSFNYSFSAPAEKGFYTIQAYINDVASGNPTKLQVYGDATITSISSPVVLSSSAGGTTTVAIVGTDLNVGTQIIKVTCNGNTSTATVTSATSATATVTVPYLNASYDLIVTLNDAIVDVSGNLYLCDTQEEYWNLYYKNNFVLVESGTFNNGTADVTLSDFLVAKYETTQAFWKTVMDTSPSSHSSSPEGIEIQEQRPVENVNWYSCIVFCNKLSILEGITPCYSIAGSTNPDDWESLSSSNVICDFDAPGYRLPTEAEWEFAARGGNLSNLYICSGGDDGNDVAWGSDSFTTHQVGLKTPNELGLYDMNGNVWEWCWDWFGEFSSTATTNPTGNASGSSRSIRGGSYYESNFSVSSRSEVYPDSTNSNVGFRLVRSSTVTFTSDSETIANNEATLGLTATTVSSSNTDVATAELTTGGIVITSVDTGTTTVTFGDGTNSGTIVVIVALDGTVSTVVYSATDFIVSNGVFMLSANSYNYALTRENLQDTTGDNAWSSVTTDNWADKTGTIIFTTTASVYNMSMAARNIVLKVKNVSSVDLYVWNNTAGRNFSYKLGNASAVELTHTGSGDEKFTFATGTTEEITIIIAGGGTTAGSVYPLGVVLSK